jgi:hypothetical protein
LAVDSLKDIILYGFIKAMRKTTLQQEDGSFGEILDFCPENLSCGGIISFFIRIILCKSNIRSDANEF